MGLFDKRKTKSIEQEVLQNMQNSALLNNLIADLINRFNSPEARWMISGEHGQTTRRTVTVKPGGFIIEIPDAYDARDKSSYIAINFSESGYVPLTAHYNKHGGIDISLSRMCYLYATALQNRLKAVMEDCEFCSISNMRDLSTIDTSGYLSSLADLLLSDNGKQAYFDYYVPVPTYSSLF